MHEWDFRVTNVNIDFNTINHAALMDGGSQLSTPHKQILPTKDKRETSEEI